MLGALRRYATRQAAPDVADEFAEMADVWRANAVRLSVYPGSWQNGGPQRFAQLKTAIGKALAAGLYPIVDWHAIGFPNGYERAGERRHSWSTQLGEAPAPNFVASRRRCRIASASASLCSKVSCSQRSAAGAFANTWPPFLADVSHSFAASKSFFNRSAAARPPFDVFAMPEPYARRARRVKG